MSEDIQIKENASIAVNTHLTEKNTQPPVVEVNADSSIQGSDLELARILSMLQNRLALMILENMNLKCLCPITALIAEYESSVEPMKPSSHSSKEGSSSSESHSIKDNVHQKQGENQAEGKDSGKCAPTKEKSDHLTHKNYARSYDELIKESSNKGSQTSTTTEEDDDRELFSSEYSDSYFSMNKIIAESSKDVASIEYKKTEDWTIKSEQTYQKNLAWIAARLTLDDLIEFMLQERQDINLQQLAMKNQSSSENAEHINGTSNENPKNQSESKAEASRLRSVQEERSKVARI